MANVKQLIEVVSAPCDECGGAGFVFFGNEYDYDVEPCDCVVEIEDELTVDWVNE
jgi:hypothetical protein